MIKLRIGKTIFGINGVRLYYANDPKRSNMYLRKDGKLHIGTGDSEAGCLEEAPGYWTDYRELRAFIVDSGFENEF